MPPSRQPPGNAKVLPEDLPVLRLLAEGATVATIGRLLHIGDRTVYRRLDELYARLGVTNRMAAVSYAFRWGVLEA